MAVGSVRRLTTQTRVTVVSDGVEGVAVSSPSEDVVTFFGVAVEVATAVVE